MKTIFAQMVILTSYIKEQIRLFGYLICAQFSFGTCPTRTKGISTAIPMNFRRN